MLEEPVENGKEEEVVTPARKRARREPASTSQKANEEEPMEAEEPNTDEQVNSLFWSKGGDISYVFLISQNGDAEAEKKTPQRHSTRVRKSTAAAVEALAEKLEDSDEREKQATPRSAGRGRKPKTPKVIIILIIFLIVY